MNVFRLELHCPDVKTQADAMQLKSVLNSSPGLNTVDVDLPTHTLVITTANQDAGRDVVQRLSHAGFPPEDAELAFAAFERG